ncbi:DUF1906 domain-containing protein [Corynebacterium uterequi]|uniref:Putative DUF1906 family protein n=1 Tax=Corynebacterium uterequi TaxID=1072256 RepID=A0A0G3HHP9_9CORY|nr:DUF1906 domain-containing protein [Corynebacterium uterequi]AKK10657.1 putative DUF1906 family protein [Corynebacterium uterequi]
MAASPSSTLSRRKVLRTAATSAGALAAVGVVLPRTATAQQAAQQSTAATPTVLGKLIDYAAGVPRASVVKAAGYDGAIRYISHRRPGEEGWMLGKPLTIKETKDFALHGLSIASVYQFGRAESADWRRGAAGVVVHAPQAMEFHRLAGGPTGKPLYIAIDDNPSKAQYESLIRPYLAAFEATLKNNGYRLGVYANYPTIDWLVGDGIGEYFWQHNWGSGGKIHPRANLHQVKINATDVDNVRVDINHIYTQDWGQWQPA